MKIFIKEADYASSPLISSFLLQFSRKTSFEENCGRKSHYIMIKGEFRTLSNISHGAIG